MKIKDIIITIIYILIYGNTPERIQLIKDIINYDSYLYYDAEAEARLKEAKEKHIKEMAEAGIKMA